jgi:hypothetical protein
MFEDGHEEAGPHFGPLLRQLFQYVVGDNVQSLMPQELMRLRKYLFGASQLLKTHQLGLYDPATADGELAWLASLSFNLGLRCRELGQAREAELCLRFSVEFASITDSTRAVRLKALALHVTISLFFDVLLYFNMLTPGGLHSA